nr:acyl-CoA dehydrogenase family protein [Nocardioides convexus]
MQTTAKRDGDHYVLNGAKTFITGGVLADRVIVCARTSPPLENNRRFGISLLAVDTKSEGWAVGRKARQGSGCGPPTRRSLSFTDVRVPVEDLLGEENEGFSYLGQNLPQERLGIAVGAYAQAAAAIRFTKAYVEERKVFGTTVASFQNTKFESRRLPVRGRRRPGGLRPGPGGARPRRDSRRWTPPRPSLFCTEVAGRVIDRCLQAARRLRLHERVPHRPALRRHPGHPDLRRHVRGHEG